MVEARIISKETGLVDVRQYDSSAQARTALFRETGKMLVWKRSAADWEAELNETVYWVEAETQKEDS